MLDLTHLNEGCVTAPVLARVEIHILLFLHAVIDGIVLPELGGTNAELGVHVRLIPENHILQLIGTSRIVNDETLIILRTLAHNLTKEVEAGKGRAEVVEDALTIINEVLTQDEDEVHIRAQNRRDTERILHGNNKEHLLVTTVEE